METLSCRQESVEDCSRDNQHPPSEKERMIEAEGEEAGITRAREILGSLKVRREVLLETVRASRSHPSSSSEQSVDSSKTSLASITMHRTTRPIVFDCKETELMTAQMTKVLQERRERLS